MTRLLIVAVVVIGLVAAAAGLDGWLSPVAAQARTSSDPLPRADRLATEVGSSLETLGQLMAGPQGQISVAERKRRLHAMAQAMRTIDALIPRDSFDVAAVVGHVGRDTRALSQWVRDHTQLVPYRGSLRGATGVLMDRTGNSLDRSILLAGLLKESGKVARLARARLTADQAKALQSISAPVKDTEPADWQNKINAVIEAYAKDIGIAGNQIRDQLQKTFGLAQDANDKLRRRVKIQTDRLVKALGPTSAAAADFAAADIEALRDHWWVQVNEGSTWVDVDPSSTDSAKPIVSAQQTFAPDALPPDLQTTVQVRVIVEKSNGTKFEEHRAVALEVRPSDVLGQAIHLQHVPLRWPGDLLPPTSDQMQRIGDAALNQHEWLPVFTIGKKVVTESSILDTGDLNKKPDPKAASVQTFIDALGGSDAPPPGMLTAEWIEYEIRSPGQSARTIRREIFDLVGPAARAGRQVPTSLSDDSKVSRALSLINDTEILIEAAQLNPAYVGHLTASAFVANEPAVAGLLDSGPLTTEALADRAKGFVQLPGILHALAVARAVGSPATPGYLSRPNILSRHMFLKESPPGSLSMVNAIDIVANDISVNHTDDVASRIAQGVTDANLEAMVLGPNADGASTADSYGLTADDNWITLRTEADVRKTLVSPEIRARFDADVRSGFVVVAPRASDAPNGVVGWWRIDPKTGDTLNMGDRGWGQAQAEYVMLKAAIAGEALYLGCIGGASLDGKLTARERNLCLTTGLFIALGGIAAGAGMIGGFAGGTLFGLGIPVALANGVAFAVSWNM